MPLKKKIIPVFEYDSDDEMEMQNEIIEETHAEEHNEINITEKNMPNIKMNVKEFCDANNILWFPINLQIVPNKDDSNKKEKILEEIRHTSYKHTKKNKEGNAYISYKPEPTDFDNLSIDIIKERQQLVTDSDWIAIDTRYVHHIDIDHDVTVEGYNKLMEVAPYFKSATKRYPHIFIKQEGFKPKSARIQLKNGGIKPYPNKNDEGVELLCGQWSYARWSDEMINPNIPPYEIIHIDTLFLDDKKVKNKSINKIPTFEDGNKSDFVVVDKSTNVHDNIKDTLFIRKCKNIDVKYINQYRNWIKIIWAIRSFNSELKDIALELTKKSHYYKTDDYFNEHWDKYNDKGLTEGTINYYSLLSNKEEHIKIISEQLVFNNPTDLGIAEIFIGFYGDLFIYTNKKLYFYNGVYWELNESKNLLRKMLCKNLVRKYNEHISDKYKQLSLIDKENDSENYRSIEKYISLCKDITKILQKTSELNSIVSMVLTLIEKEVEFDENPYLFAFNNVIWDLKEGKIIPSSPNQMISLTTGYDYDINMTDLEVRKITLMDILKEIFPDESVRNYDLIVRSSGLVGVQVQNLIVSNGVGGNGKTILNELMISSVGNYGYVLSSTCLTQEIKTGANPELANLHNKRYILSSEPPSKKAICCSTMKTLTGNTTLPVRGLYESKCETKLKGTLDLDCNGLPKFDEVDDAVNRRIRAIPFESRFVDASQYEVLKDRPNVFKMNAQYKTDSFKTEYRQVLFHILMDYLPKFLDTQLLPNPPNKCKKLTADMLASSDDLFGWFTTNYKKDDNNVLSFSDIYDKYRSSSYFLNLSKKDQREQNRAKFTKMIETNLFLKDCIKRRKQKFNGIQLDKDSIVGWIKKVNEDDDDSDELN